MTAGFGNRLRKLTDPGLEASVEEQLAPSVELTAATVSWTRGSICGRRQFDKWIQALKEFDRSAKCGRVWGSDYIAYRCRT